ncbi:DUF805 domain-containing protein [Sulfuriferula sp. GW1]|uniref:DUF805 domain-containing protein n=1 Tax=Sulfuriferula sp. GW1 TaxID=3345111 RepID=UPI0039B06355
MNSANPYQVPQSNVDHQGQDDYSEVKVLSISGRIGRLRYLGYTMGYGMLIYIAFAAIGGVMIAMGLPRGIFMGMVVIGYVLAMVLSIMLTIQRAHDFDKTGWLALLAFIPLLNLIFWFVPGTEGENRFGKQTPPNRGGLVWVVVAILAIAMIGILAAIAIPAYQSYVHRAQAAAQNNLPAPAAQSR